MNSPQFPVAKQLKWKRPAPGKAEAGMLAAESGKLRRSAAWMAAAGRESAARLGIETGGNGTADLSGGTPAKSYSVLQPELIIHTADRSVKLSYGQYSINGDRLAVPVRLVAEALGGGVKLGCVIRNVPAGSVLRRVNSPGQRDGVPTAAGHGMRSVDGGVVLAGHEAGTAGKLLRQAVGMAGAYGAARERRQRSWDKLKRE